MTAVRTLTACAWNSAFPGEPAFTESRFLLMLQAVNFFDLWRTPSSPRRAAALL